MLNIPITQAPKVSLLSRIGGFIGGPLGSLATGLLGGIFSGRSAKRQQQRQIALAREQMAFQERMSSTQVQRRVEDLIKAGLNPILAAGAGASSPGGAMAQLGMAPENIGLATAQQLARNKEELRNVRSQNDLIYANTQSARALRTRTNIENQIKQKEADTYEKYDWLMPAKLMSGPGSAAVGSAFGLAKIVQSLKSIFSKATTKTTDIIKHGPHLTRKITTGK